MCRLGKDVSACLKTRSYLRHSSDVRLTSFVARCVHTTCSRKHHDFVTSVASFTQSMLSLIYSKHDAVLTTELSSIRVQNVNATKMTASYIDVRCSRVSRSYSKRW